MKALLYKYGFGYVWEANTVGDINRFVDVFKQHLKDCCLQAWHSDIFESPKSIHYSKFKEILEIEIYLTIDLPYLLWKILANFRCSGHSLMVEKGRHQNIERNLRFCKLCLKRNVYSIEDEFHLFCVCPFYKDFRDLYFKPQWNKDIITINNFYTIMSQTDKHSIMSISRFLVRAFSYRKQLLQTDTQCLIL